MLEEARAKCKKSLQKQMIWSAVIAIVLLLAPLMAPLSLILGPKELDAKNMEDYKGKYVSYTIRYAFVDYAESYSVNKDTGNRVRTNSYSYVIYDWDSNTCFSVEVSSKDYDTMEDIEDETLDYCDGAEKGETSLRIKGTLRELKGEELEYFKEGIEYTGAKNKIKNISEHTKYFVIDYDEVNGIPMVVVIFAYIGIAVCVIIFIVGLVKTLTDAPNKKLKKFLDANMTVREDQIDTDMRGAVKVGANVWAGKQYTVYLVSSTIRVLVNKNLVWAYYYKRTGRNAVSQVRTFNKDKKMVVINLSEALSKQLLAAYAEMQPQMVLGYDRDLEKMYNKDFTGFLNLRYNQAQQQMAENTADFGSDYMNSGYTSEYASSEQE
ncbi:MAG: hypothetical protein IJY09_10855 [Lachnospiraceae bacterium]|nr:hypothetical protein [Lachnospiraceae bacterium]